MRSTRNFVARDKCTKDDDQSSPIGRVTPESDRRYCRLDRKDRSKTGRSAKKCDIPDKEVKASTQKNRCASTPKKGAPGKKSSNGKAASSKGSKLRSMKQKVKSYPRDRIHFYNKVVRRKNNKKSRFYFVLHYDEPKATIRIVPMEAKGILSGKRQGRPRYQALLNDSEDNVKTVFTSDYEIIPAFMVMKTPYVASEAWDILS